MKKNKHSNFLHLLITLIIFLGLVACSSNPVNIDPEKNQDTNPENNINSADNMIADHSVVNILRLGKLPETAIQHAKKTLHIAYGHTSHGSQVTIGMRDLVDFANNGGLITPYSQNLFAWNNGGTNGALDLHDYAMGGDCGYYPQWVNNTRYYLGVPDSSTGKGTNNPDVNVIIWSWCGQVDAKYAEGRLESDYIEPMAQLEKDYPGITFVYMTGHVDHYDDSNNKAANKTIRDYCRENNKVLFDFADIESYDPDGNYYEFPHDNCDYYSSLNGELSGNWAITWQRANPGKWYDCGSSHSMPLNANMKAYAAWWLWCRIAGWNGKL